MPRGMRPPALRLDTRSLISATAAASYELGPHIHQEYHSGHPFLDPTTLPLIFRLNQDSKPTL